MTADAQDPDGDALTYQWTASAGSLDEPDGPADAVDRAEQPGTVPFTVTVNDGRAARPATR